MWALAAFEPRGHIEAYGRVEARALWGQAQCGSATVLSRRATCQASTHAR